ncbi:MAG TPA: hypothetical protein PLD47_12370 [Aggregatilineales bacterium]|nr:hypothetical protein [Anaerolineales bacterium]HRE48511.1 hypothetical protein [Aggregatilineales bacterium]
MTSDPLTLPGGVPLAIVGIAVPGMTPAAFMNAMYAALNPVREQPNKADLVARALQDAARHTPTGRVGEIATAGDVPNALIEAARWLGVGTFDTVILVSDDPHTGGAVALSRAEGAPAYAILRSIAMMPAEALARAGVTPAHIGYLELTHMVPESFTEMGVIAPIYQHSDLTCAVGGGYGGMLGLIRGVLAVAGWFLPALPAWKAPERPELWGGTPFYTLSASKAWLDRTRRAAVSFGAAAHAVLEQAVGVPYTDDLDSALATAPPYLFLVGGENAAAVLNGLDGLETALNSASDLLPVASDQYRRYELMSDPSFVVALVAANADGLRKEIALARTGVPKAFSEGGTWTTPAGSSFSAAPLRGEVAFVYPGAFSAYPRMGQDLFHLVPDLYGALRDATSDLGRSVGDRALYMRTLAKSSTKDWRLFREKLEGTPPAMMEAGMTFATIMSRVLRDTFQIAPTRAFGYSLGEGSMLWGMGVWKDGDAGSVHLHESPLWTRLFGRKETVRAVFGVPDNAPDDFWAVYFIAASPEAVIPLLEREPRVFLTHINTPNEVTIAGDPAACKRILEALKGEHMKAPFSMVMHCEPAVPDYAHFFTLHHRPVYERPAGVTFYASADYAPTVLDQGVLGHNISRAAVKLLDFPRLVRRVYDDGARIFIEIGPRNACARWVTETLGVRPHVAVAANQPGVDDKTGLVRLLARLVAQRVPLTLAPLYQTLGDQPRQALDVGTAHGNHAAYLAGRTEALRDLVEQLQAGKAPQPHLSGEWSAAASSPAALPPPTSDPSSEGEAVRVSSGQLIRVRKPAIFTEADIHEFALGDVVRCFGEEYSIYRDRRAPRIPNGDLLLVSRITEIHGKRHDLAAGSRIVSEYDVPDHPWFVRDNAGGGTPYSVYMEMALQLCGFLSAYLGSTLVYPDLDFYFRNLDGDGILHRDLDLRGKTITNHVTMTSSITMQGIILQKFTFALSTEGEPFYEGSASFGCFTAEAMANQVGLDKGKPVPTWLESSGMTATALDLPRLHSAPVGKPQYRLSGGQLDFVDGVSIVPNGGKYGQGYLYVQENIEHGDWFFTNHFYQDPVMPGSLGVEATLQGMQAYALALGLGVGLRAPHFAQAAGHKTVWRYRGQVTRLNKRIWKEVHIKRIEQHDDGIVLVGDGSLWRDDGLRIYEMIDAAVAIREG